RQRRPHRLRLPRSMRPKPRPPRTSARPKPRRRSRKPRQRPLSPKPRRRKPRTRKRTLTSPRDLPLNDVPAIDADGGHVRLRLDIAYDGTDFAGWATQSGQRTVAGVLDEV